MATPTLQRSLEDDHQPPVSSPLNPDLKVKEEGRERAPRAKKDSFKKREAKQGSLASDVSARGTPDPKGRSKGKKHEEELSPMRYKLAPPQTNDFNPPEGPIFVPSHTKTAPDGTTIQFNEAPEQLLNKKHFKYTHAVADPDFPASQYYRQSEAAPFGPRLNFEDTASHMFLDAGGMHITTKGGYRMGKANICVREGKFYYEVKITSGIQSSRKRKDAGDGKDGGHVRMGWARREANLDTPVGYDAYSYGLRDVKGQASHMSRQKDFFPPGEDMREGDVIGLEINLPSETLHHKVVEGQYNPAVDLTDDGNTDERHDIIRDRVPIRFKGHLYFEQVDYHPSKELEELFHPAPVISSSGGFGSSQAPSPTHPIPCLRTLPHSCIKVYKNGQYMGVAFKDLLAFLPPASNPLTTVGVREGLDDGMLGYFPAVSVFGDGAAEVNFGPDFWYPPPGMKTQDDEVDMIGNDTNTITLPALPELGELRGAGERFDEQIVEDVVQDVVDEVDFWMQQGGNLDNEPGANGDGPSTLSFPDAAHGNEIKELVQDDD